MCSIPMDMTIVLGLYELSLQVTIDHRGPSIYLAHHITSINYCNVMTAKLPSLKWYRKLLYCICSKISVDYVVFFGLEQKDGSVTTPLALAHPLHPIKVGRGISTGTYGLEYVFHPDDIGSGFYTRFIIVYMPCIIAAFWVNEISSFLEIYTYQGLVWPDSVLDAMMLLFFPVWSQIYISIAQFRILYIIIWI